MRSSKLWSIIVCCAAGLSVLTLLLHGKTRAGSAKQGKNNEK